MKQILFALALLISTVSALKAQEQKPIKDKFRPFTRAEVSYLFGINDTYNNQKINSLHIKITIGSQNSRVGFGIGLENASYRAANGNGTSFETLNFSGNAHVLAKPIDTDEINFFIKGAAGYAPRIFREYNKGFNYEVAPGILFTTKKKSKYFLQAMYQFQEIANVSLASGRPQIKGIGIGVGGWF